MSVLSKLGASTLTRIICFRFKVLVHAVQDAVPRPPVHTRVDRVSVAEPLRQASPLVAMLGHVENGMGNCRLEKLTLPRCLGSSGTMNSYCTCVSFTCPA